MQNAPTTSLADTESASQESTASASQPPTTSAPATVPSTPPQSIAAATPYGEAPEPSEPNDTSIYVTRRSMTAESIELRWSGPEGAADYQMHRLPRTSDTRPEVSAMTAENVIHSSADEQGDFLDANVIEGSTYWYGMRSLNAADEVMATGWHRADAVTDEEPPSPVELSLDLENGAVLLTWDRPADNYEVASYHILRSVDGDELDGISAAYNPDQTSFVDPEPPKGTVTYAVFAMDFHWNKTEPTVLTVEIP